MANYNLHLPIVSMPQRLPNAIGLTLDTSDLVLKTLGNAARYTHVPFLQGAAGLALNIVEIAQNARSNKSAFKRLANDACALVYIVIRNHGNALAGSANVIPGYSSHAKELSETLQEIYNFTKAQASKHKALRIIQSKSDAGVIQEYRERLKQSLDVFGLNSRISIQDSLMLVQKHLSDIQVNQIQELKEQITLFGHSNEQAHQDLMTESTYEVDQEESKVVLDPVIGPETSFVAVLNRVHDAEFVNADMMAVGGDTNASSGLQTRSKIEQVSTLLSKVILDTVMPYRRLLSCNKVDAQKILDASQMLLDNESFQDRSQLIAAMRRLSERTNLYPTRFFLKGSPPSLRDIEPDDGGKFAEVYNILFQGEETCFKVFRVYKRSQVEHMAKVYAREVIPWAQLSHPNILPFYGLIQVGGRLAFVSRWATNGNLKDYLIGNPDANRLLLCSDTAAGVKYLHKNDIVHGDLKGLNVLIDSSGRAALGDFGLSCVTDPQILEWSTQSTMTSKGGTVRWQGPELLASEDEKTHNTKASDVFAWAGVCYEIFTGHVPYYEISNLTAVMLSIQRGDTPTRAGDSDPAWREHGLTPRIWELIMNCWNFSPSERPDMSTVVRELQVDTESVPDSRPPGEWMESFESNVVRRFRNAQDTEESGQDLHVGTLQFWEELEALLARIVQPGHEGC